MYADGAPPGSDGRPLVLDQASPPETRTNKMPRLAGRVRTIEGPRGVSTRAAVYVRYMVYGLIIAVASAATHALFAGTPWSSGGYVMFYASVSMLLTATVGTWLYVNQRNEIIEQVRHYVFGFAVFPGLFFAGLYRVTLPGFASEFAQTDAFLSVVGNVIPILYFVTVLIPAAIFVKVISGIRNLHRSSQDDQELLGTISRQDGRQV